MYHKFWFLRAIIGGNSPEFLRESNADLATSNYKQAQVTDSPQPWY